MSRHHAALGALLIAACLAIGTGDAYGAASPDAPNRDSARGDTQVRPDGAPPPAPTVTRKRRMSTRCNTPMLKCIQLEPEPVGSSCWCITPFGPSYGRLE